MAVENGMRFFSFLRFSIADCALFRRLPSTRNFPPPFITPCPSILVPPPSFIIARPGFCRGPESPPLAPLGGPPTVENWLSVFSSGQPPQCIKHSHRSAFPLAEAATWPPNDPLPLLFVLK